MTTTPTVPACAHAPSSSRGAPAMASGQRDRDRPAVVAPSPRRGATLAGHPHPLTLTAVRRPLLTVIAARGLTPLRAGVTGSGRPNRPAEATTACDGKGAAWANTEHGANRPTSRFPAGVTTDWAYGPGGADAPGGDRRPLFFILHPFASLPCLADRGIAMTDHARASAGLCEEAEQIADTWARIRVSAPIDTDDDAEMTCLVTTHVANAADHDEAIAVVVAELRCGLEAPRPVRLRRERTARLRLLRPAYGVIADGTLEEQAA